METIIPMATNNHLCTQIQPLKTLTDWGWTFAWKIYTSQPTSTDLELI
ncbi:hypothetical protein Goklo_005711 [Gossypium klotzschianum]|uniref:Uncharacterized protein n=1 Tax=Gossypium klotzschianum TaxID=34286 RepID=A0A7J8VF40_9ROSI|nr:hypothetical protein [Gossypium klotzschianum]